MTTSPVRGSVTIVGAVLLLVLAAVVAFVAGGVAVAIQALGQGLEWDRAAGAVVRDPLLLALCQVAGLGTATGVGVLAAFGSDEPFREALDVRPVAAAVAVLALTAGFALQFPLHELANLLLEIDPRLGMDEEAQRAVREMIRIDSVWEAITVPLAVVAAPAVFEELLFRGLLLPGLSRRYSIAVGWALSSILFGVIHAVPVAIAYATVAGFALGWVRIRTGSVLPCVAMHGAFNAVPVLLPSEVVRIEGFNTAADDVYHLPLALVIGAAAVAGLCMYVMARLTDRPE